MEGLGGQLRYEPPVCSGGGGGLEGVAPGWSYLEAATRGGARRRSPARSRKHARATARCTWCALATAMPTSLSLLPAATPALCPPARWPCGRSRSRRQVALGVWPSKPESRRARPSGHPARPSPRSAPHSPHLRPLAIFTPPSGPAWAPDSVLSN